MVRTNRACDGRGRWLDNRFIERLWRSVKYEDIYLQDYGGGLDAGRGLPAGFTEPDLEALSLPTGARLAYDMDRNPVVLLFNDWSANYFAQTNPNVALSSQPFERVI